MLVNLIPAVFLSRYVKGVSFFKKEKVYESGRFPVKMVYKGVRGWTSGWRFAIIWNFLEYSKGHLSIWYKNRPVGKTTKTSVSTIMNEITNFVLYVINK